MRSILTTAILTFRENERSKIRLAIDLVVMLVTLLLPMALEGDGTDVGTARMMLLYPISIAFGFLALSALWTSATSISGDVKRRTLQLVRVKPVAMWRLWLGKWLGLLFLFAATLAIPFIVINLYLANSISLDEIAISKELHSPELPPVEAQVEEAMRHANASGRMSPEELRDLRADLMRQLPYAVAALPSGQSWTWRFTLPENGNDAPLFLRLRFNGDALSSQRPVAECVLRQRGASDGFRFTISDFSNREQEISIPGGTVRSGGEIELIVNNAGADGASDIITQPRQWIHLMRGAGSLYSNMLRAYAVLLSIIALLLAVGLTAGAFFTIPVAVFATTCLILTAVIGNYVASDQSMLEPDYTTPPTPIVRFQTAFSVGVVKSISFVTAPALKPSPIASLAASEVIEGREIARCVACNLVAIPAVLALISSFYLARKELPE